MSETGIETASYRELPYLLLLALTVSSFIMAGNYSTLILDLGGVVFNYSISSNTVIPPRTIRVILDSLTWYEYESGRLTTEQCTDEIVAKFGLDREVWESTMKQLQGTLDPNMEFVAAIKDIRAKHPDLNVYAFSNMSNPDYLLLKERIQKLDIIDKVFTSASLGCRKPDLCSYTKVLKLIGGVNANSAIFIDDQMENVISARSLGIQTIHFDNTKNVVSRLNNFLGGLGDPVDRGMEFMRREAGNMFSETQKGIIIRENFSQLLILQYTGDRDLVTLENDGITWQYFIGGSVLTDKVFPDDVDTTALAVMTPGLLPEDQKDTILNMMLDNLSVDKLPLTYFDESRRRFCPYVAANVLRAFWLGGRGHELESTLSHLSLVLDTEAYELGSKIYCQPDWIIHVMADFAGECDDPQLNELRRILREQLQRRMGINKDINGAAMRALACQSLGMHNPRDLETLLNTQSMDGGWPLDWTIKYGKADVRLGSRGVTTAMALKAIKTARERGQL